MHGLINGQIDSKMNEQMDKDKCSTVLLLGVTDTKKKEFSKNKMTDRQMA
jgi:hypothetical protein